jgi:hypothetical protein
MADYKKCPNCGSKEIKVKYGEYSTWCYCAHCRARGPSAGHVDHNKAGIYWNIAAEYPFGDDKESQRFVNYHKWWDGEGIRGGK